jgi:hypothetical protein
MTCFLMRGDQGGFISDLAVAIRPPET